MRRLFLKLFMGGSASVLLCVAQNADTSAVKQLNADQLKKLLEQKKVFFLDVREPKELEELGTIKGYVNIPLGQLEQRLNQIPRDALVVTA